MGNIFSNIKKSEKSVSTRSRLQKLFEERFLEYIIIPKIKISINRSL